MVEFVYQGSPVTVGCALLCLCLSTKKLNWVPIIACTKVARDVVYP